MTPAPLRRLAAVCLAALPLLAPVALLPRAAAQAAPAVLDLEATLAAGDGRLAVVLAQLDLADAERAFERTEADPLALRLERTQARQAVELAHAELAAARAEAAAELAAAWARVREATAQVALAEGARDLTARAVEVANLRFERGSATRLDVEEAATDLADAEANVAAARAGLALARADLAGIAGVDAPVATEPVARERLLRPLPDDAALAAAVAALPAYLRAAHGVELAGLALELLDPSFAAQAQIDQARTQRAQAEAGLAEAARGLTLQGSATASRARRWRKPRRGSPSRNSGSPPAWWRTSPSRRCG